jgi:hypothetical protein
MEKEKEEVVKFLMLLTKGERDQLKAIAREESRSMAGQMRHLLLQYIADGAAK